MIEVILFFTDDTKQPKLQRVTDKGLADFEKEFLKWLWGNNKQLLVKICFQILKLTIRYIIEVRKLFVSAGNRVRQLLKCYLKLITENIHEIIEREQLPNNYRPVAKRTLVFISFNAPYESYCVCFSWYFSLDFLEYGLVFYQFVVSFFIAGGMLYYL